MIRLNTRATCEIEKDGDGMSETYAKAEQALIGLEMERSNLESELEDFDPALEAASLHQPYECHTDRVQAAYDLVHEITANYNTAVSRIEDVTALKAEIKELRQKVDDAQTHLEEFRDDPDHSPEHIIWALLPPGSPRDE